MRDRHLFAWGSKRIEDMDREDLLDALNAMHRSYCDIVQINVRSSPHISRDFNWSMAETDEALQRLFEAPMMQRASK